MLFTIPNKFKTNPEKLRVQTLIGAYQVIKSYPMNGAECVLDEYIKQQYKTSLKDLCVDLLLHMKFQVTEDNDLILLFNDNKYDMLAQLITFGNGAIQGSRILQFAFYK